MAGAVEKIVALAAIIVVGLCIQHPMIWRMELAKREYQMIEGDQTTLGLAVDLRPARPELVFVD